MKKNRDWSYDVVLTDELIDIFEKALKKKSSNFYIESDNYGFGMKFLKYKGLGDET